MILPKAAANRAKTVLYSEETLVKARKKPVYFTRERKMSFPVILEFMLSRGLASIQTELNDFFFRKGSETHMTEQAFSKARSHFDHSPFLKLYQELVKEDYANVDQGDPDYVRLNGLKVFAIDGSTVALPDNPETRSEFGVSGANPGRATARMSVLYDVMNDRSVDMALEPFHIGERELAIRHIHALSALCKTDDALILFDRGYISAKILRELNERNIRFLFRVKKNATASIAALPMGCTKTEYAPGLPVMGCRFFLDSGEEEILITNVMGLTEQEYKELYFLRWPIEGKYDIIKNKFCLEAFTGTSCNAILQDFWCMADLNYMVEINKTYADRKIAEARQEKQNKHTYQANTSELVHSLKKRFICAALTMRGKKRDNELDAIQALIQASVVPIRPGRTAPRSTPDRHTKFFPNKKLNA